MALLNTQIKRPLLHHLIILGYFLAPVVNVLIFIKMNDYPLWFVLDNFFRFFKLFGGILIILMPFIALSLYVVNKYSFYVFLLHSLLVLLDNFIKIFSHFSMYQFGLLLGSIILFVAIYYILQKDFRAPYFQVLGRTFREKNRVPIHHFISATLGTKKTRKIPINDISPGGCYITEKFSNIYIGQKFDLEFNAQNFNFLTQAEIVRIDQNGFGVRFQNLTKELEKEIDLFVKTRFALRYKVNFAAILTLKKKKIAGRLIDVSDTGSFFQPDNDQLKFLDKSNKGDAIHLSFVYNNETIDLEGNIVWFQPNPSLNKPIGCALNFNKKFRKKLNPITKEISKTSTMIR